MNAEFRNATIEHGLNPPNHITPGKIHRFPGVGKNNGNKAGWCLLFDDCEGGVYGDYSTDFTATWQLDKAKTYSPEERREFARQVAESKKRVKAEVEVAQMKAADECLASWKAATPETGQHKYLRNKKVQAYGIKSNGVDLLIPLYMDGKISSIQTINPNGEKRFHKGGRVKECYFPIGKPDGVLCLVEGYATGATIREATGYAVAVCFSAGNLKPVAEYLSKKLPDTRFIYCADDDSSGVGKKSAQDAAQAVSGVIVLPECNGTDFNDMAAEKGIQSVADLLMEGIPKFRPFKPFQPAELLPVLEVPMKALPDDIKAWVADVSSRVGCAPDYLVVGVLTILSSLLGRKVLIQPKARHDWTVTANLYGAIIGRPSTKKSPALNECLYYIQDMDTQARTENDEALAMWRGEKKLFDIQQSELKKQAQKEAKRDRESAIRMLRGAEKEIQKPPQVRYVINDATVEKLAMIMADNNNALLTMRDEIAGFLADLDKPENASSRAFYLQMFNGNQPYSYDRVTRDSVNIPHCVGSILGGIQPSKLKQYLIPTMTGNQDDGLLQRFQLIAYPDPVISTGIDEYPDKEAKQSLTAIFDYFAGLLEGEPVSLSFDSDAQALFYEWEAENTQKQKTETSTAMESHLAKFPAFISSLALIIHLADNKALTPISIQSLAKAIGLAEYFESQARRIYAMGDVQNYEARSLAEKMHRLGNPFKKADFRVKGWAGLTKSADRDKALSILVERGYLAEVKQQVKNNARNVSVYYINAALEEG